MGPLWSLLFILFAAGAGTQLLRWAGIRLERPLERLTFGGAVGLGLAAYAVLGIGLAGGLTRTAIWALAGVVAVVGAAQAWGLARDGGAAAVRWATAPRARGDWGAVLLVVACVTLAVLTLIPAVVPPDEGDWDTLSYHLAAPKIYLQHHRIAFIDYDSHTNFPFTVEMLFTLGLAWGGPGAAKVFHWAMGWLTAVAVGAWVQRHLRPSEEARSPAPEWAGPLAAALWLSIPLVIWEAGTGYIDLGTAFFQFTAIAALTRLLTPGPSPTTPVGEGSLRSAPGEYPTGVALSHVTESGHARNKRDQRSDPSPPSPAGRNLNSLTHPRPAGEGPGVRSGPYPDLRWAALAGILTGWALGTKPTALLQAGLLGLLLLWFALRTRERPAWAATLLFGGLALLVGSPWYVKSYLWTNNPVYPFFYSLFPNSVSWTRPFEEAYRAEQKSFGRGYGPLELLRAPWDLAFNARHYFITTQRRLSFDKLASMGTLAVGFGPLLLYARRPDRKVWLLAGYGVASGLVWWFLSQQSRYLMPVFAPLAAAAAGVVMALEGALLRRAAFGLAGVSVAVGLYDAGQMAAYKWPVASGQVSGRQYLAEPPRDLYPTAEFVNRLPRNSRVALYQESRGFYFDRDYMWANPMQHNLIPYETFQDGGQLVDFLKQKQRITHVLINLNLARSPGLDGQRWWRLLMDAAGRGRIVPVYESRPDGLRGMQGIVVFEAR